MKKASCLAFLCSSALPSHLWRRRFGPCTVPSQLNHGLIRQTSASGRISKTRSRNPCYRLLIGAPAVSLYAILRHNTRGKHRDPRRDSACRQPAAPAIHPVCVVTASFLFLSTPYLSSYKFQGGVHLLLNTLPGYFAFLPVFFGSGVPRTTFLPPTPPVHSSHPPHRPAAHPPALANNIIALGCLSPSHTASLFADFYICPKPLLLWTRPSRRLQVAIALTLARLLCLPPSHLPA